MNIANSIWRYIVETDWFHLIKGNHIRICGKSIFKTEKNVQIRNSRIFITGDAVVELLDNVKITNSDIYVDGGKLILGSNTIMDNCHINLQNSSTLTCSHHSKLACKRIWQRFGSNLSIGEYTNINAGSEIRCDEDITIGSYCQISYNVNIWDTNTHNMLPPAQRKELAEKHFPYFGFEVTKPKTEPIRIGNYCWLGEGSAVMKGAILGNNVTVGYHTSIFGQNIPDNRIVVTENKIRII